VATNPAASGSQPTNTHTSSVSDAGSTRTTEGIVNAITPAVIAATVYRIVRPSNILRRFETV